MVKVSASREMTTPWNFIFDPLGTDRRLTFWLLGVWLVETWAEAAIARTSRPHTRVNGRNLLIAIMLIYHLLQYLVGMHHGTPGFSPSVLGRGLARCDARTQGNETHYSSRISLELC